MRQSATERAYLHVKERILDGRLAGSELISEGEIAGAVRMSRTPVREAFLRLESEGLLRLYPQRGAFVVPVTATEVEDVMETRNLVELHAIALVASGTTAATVADRLEGLIGEQESLAAAGDAPGFVRADGEFHRTIVGAAQNAILVDLHDSLRDRQARMGLVAISRDAGRVRHIVDEHRAIARAIRAGDAQRARTLLERHLEGTLALLRGAGQREFA